jgi:ABC-2 type transport system permease protein
MSEQLALLGSGGYIIMWLGMPVFSLAVAGLIYRAHRPELVGYAVVGIATSSFISNSLYYIGQILDEERIGGTLVGLFLSPSPRIGWLTGFAAAGLAETSMAGIATVIFGRLAFNVTFHPDYLSLAIAFILFLSSLWGMGFMFSALGLILKRSNDVANLVSSFVFLLGGIYYPVALLPVWLRYPADALPLGYGIQALAGASLHHASLAQLAPQLVPLALFATVLPVAGVLAFAWIDRLVRQRGELDLY